MNIAITIIIILLILLIGYYTHQYKINCSDPIKFQSPYPIEIRDHMTLVMDSINSTKNVFQENYTNTQIEKLRTDAIRFFKEQFGLSGKYINKQIIPFRLNPEMPLMHIESNTQINQFGYGIMLTPGIVLHGKYGGKKGVFICARSTIGYGMYDIPGQYQLIWRTYIPIKQDNNQNGEYMHIEYNIEVLSAKRLSLTSPLIRVGMTGTAFGLYKMTHLNNDTFHHMERNVIIFNK